MVTATIVSAKWKKKNNSSRILPRFAGVRDNIKVSRGSTLDDLY